MLNFNDLVVISKPTKCTILFLEKGNFLLIEERVLLPKLLKGSGSSTHVNKALANNENPSLNEEELALISQFFIRFFKKIHLEDLEKIP